MTTTNTKTCTHGNHRAKDTTGTLVKCGAPATHVAASSYGKGGALDLCGRHASAAARFGFPVEVA